MSQMIKSADGSAGFCTRSPSPRHGEEGCIFLKKKEEEDARQMDRCEAKRKKWARHWQCDENVQNMEDKLLAMKS